MQFYDVRESPFQIYGLYHCQQEPQFKRLPDAVARAANPGVAQHAKHTAGGRVKFRTDSRTIAVRVKMESNCDMAKMPRTGTAGCDLYCRMGSRYQYQFTFAPETIDHGYCIEQSFLDRAERDCMIHLPLYSGVTSVEIGLEEGAALTAGAPYQPGPPVVYYGSSITQGACASRPGNSYEAIISRNDGRDFLNLGFSGSALGEPCIAEYISSLPMSVFVMDYDHNAPNCEHLARTHAPFFRTVRKANPNLPVVFVTRPNFDKDPHDSILRREIVHETFLRAVKDGDRNVYFIDGQSLFEGRHRDACTVDNCHPNDLGFYRMAEKIGETVDRLLP